MSKGYQRRGYTRWKISYSIGYYCLCLSYFGFPATTFGVHTPRGIQ